MSALFRCPPEVLLRSAIRQGQNLTRNAQTPKLHRCLQVSPVSSARSTHRAAVCTELGKPLKLQEVPSEELCTGQKVRLSIKGCGINYSDLLMAAGLYQDKPPLPFIPGAEVAGDVIEVAEGVTSVSKGDRVVAMAALGGFAEQCIVDEESVFRMPDSMSYEEGAAVVISYGTAWLGLTRRANTKPGETVLVTAAAGAVGLATVDLATNVIGAKVIGAAGGPEKCKVVADKGAIGTIDYNTQSIRDVVKEMTDDRGADVICDAVGGDVFKQCLRCIAWEGRILVIGFAGGDIPKIPANILLVKNISAVGLFWGNYRINDESTHRKSIQDVLGFYQEGKIKPHIGKTFSLDKANEAFMYIHKRKSTGKVVITM
ncbi:quinone oxidoreductase-like protein 2 homolog [Amphiura filiformis]|uniref:quinone oxidoreductase-like protein 2 homolog n=1 Tax=Amphiura filiformis TaxID=82378 RepID=UPI003B221925